MLTIQSMKPASISGTRHDMPSPAGVSAPLSDRPTVASSASILRGEQPARLAQPAGVVGQERLVDQLRQRRLAGQRRRVDALVADLVQILLTALHRILSLRINPILRAFFLRVYPADSNPRVVHSMSSATVRRSSRAPPKVMPRARSLLVTI